MKGACVLLEFCAVSYLSCFLADCSICLSSRCSVAACWVALSWALYLGLRFPFYRTRIIETCILEWTAKASSANSSWYKRQLGLSKYVVYVYERVVGTNQPINLAHFFLCSDQNNATSAKIHSSVGSPCHGLSEPLGGVVAFCSSHVPWGRTNCYLVVRIVF